VGLSAVLGFVKTFYAQLLNAKTKELLAHLQQNAVLGCARTTSVPHLQLANKMARDVLRIQSAARNIVLTQFALLGCSAN